MDKADCFELGYVAKLHGYKGEVSLFFDVTVPQEYAQLDSVFIDVNGQLTPFFVEKIQLNNKGFARVKFEEVNAEETARKLLHRKLYLPLTLLPELEGNQFYDHEIVGFTVLDENFGEVGTITDVIDHTSNPLFQIDFRGKEILIPIFDGLIKKVDRSNKRLVIKSPDGLIELYTSS